MQKPFFYDITLRDGNQSLKKPWNIEEKLYIFNLLKELGVQAVEAGFPAASEMDFESVQKIAEIAPDNIIISALARCVKSDIQRAYDAIKLAPKKRIHTFITLSPFHMEYVLKKSPDDVRKSAIEGVKFAKEIIRDGEVQFSVEHFGDCHSNLDFVIDCLKDIVEAGATTINLPNTVERYRPKRFLDMVERVRKELPDHVTVAVHNHNDLGMATATTVESYFRGAVQLECSLNGLGERAGNTNLYEVAIALHNSEVEVPLNLSKIYELAIEIAQMSGVDIAEKAPLIGPDSLAHRSGIHQDGALKTKDMEMGAYRPINPTLIGRNDSDKIAFTSQSGKTAIFEIIKAEGYPITLKEAIRIAPFAKELAEIIGEVNVEKLIGIYINHVLDVKGKFDFIDFTKLNENLYELKFMYNNNFYMKKGEGNGPVACCLDALKKAGFEQKLVHYEQFALDEHLLGSSAKAMSVIHLQANDEEPIIARAVDNNTATANVKAIFNGMNLLYK